MTKEGVILINEEHAGTLIYNGNEYVFKYDDAYFNNSQKKAISVTLPKTQQVYTSNVLFPFFFNMLSEGVNKKLQCRQLKIDENDYFSLLLATAGIEIIGAVSVKANIV